MTLFVVLGVVVLVIGVLVAVALGVRSMRADGREQPGRRRSRSTGPGGDSHLLDEPEPRGRRAADGSRRSSRRAGAGPRPDRYVTDPGYRADRDDYDTGPGFDAPAARGRRRAGSASDRDEVPSAAGETEMAPPSAGPSAGPSASPSARAGRRGQDQRKRSRPGRGRQARADDDDWPDTGWANVSDEDFWADISSDKPLATTARSAQSAADLTPPDVDLEPAAAEPRRSRSRRARREEPAFDSTLDAGQPGPDIGQETMGFPSSEVAASAQDPPSSEYTDPNLAVLASLGVTPPEGSREADPATDTPPAADPLTSSSFADASRSLSPDRWSYRGGESSWEPSREFPGLPASSGGYYDPAATQAFRVDGGPGDYGLPGPGTPERDSTSYGHDSYPDGSFAESSYLNSSYLGSSYLGETREFGGDSQASDFYSRDSYTDGSYSGSSYSGSSYPGDSSPGGSDGGESYRGDSYLGGSYQAGSYGSHGRERDAGSSYDRFGPSGDYGSAGDGSYGNGSYSSPASSYDAGAYGAGSYGSDSHGTGSYGGDSYGTGSYNGDSYSTGSYSSDSYRTGSYGGDSYGTGSYNGDSYSTGSYSSDSYRTGSYGRDSYDVDSYGTGTYHNGEHHNGEYQNGDAGSHWHETGSGSSSHDPAPYGTPEPTTPPAPNAGGGGRYAGGYLSSSALSARPGHPDSAGSGGNPYGSYVNGSSGADNGYPVADWPPPGDQADGADYSAYGRHRHPPGGRHR
jgi:hypothetical protein